MQTSIYSFHDCNLGQVLIVTSNDGIKTIELADSLDILTDFAKEFDSLGHQRASDQHDRHQRWCGQALDLVNGKSTSYSPPIDPDGTDFQQSVWKQLQQIGAGQTRTYQQIADAIGRPTACRAVASAIGANPIAVLIPCHRVIRKDGTLSGFRWGVERKRALLDREGWSANTSHDRAQISPVPVF
ncbi:UNVERIFIED_CONTAM: hypothetical protein GTU68_054338 [Idotea baltica]|nr:hypothetical protein [Idotea baltica]